MILYRQPPAHLAKYYCAGVLVSFFASDSSYACTECGWIGWPQTEIADDNSGRILSFYPHPRNKSLPRARP
jgi:hypothetical protein